MGLLLLSNVMSVSIVECRAAIVESAWVGIAIVEQGGEAAIVEQGINC